jgi:hypothetical protein
MPRRKFDLSTGVKRCPRCKQTKPLSEFHKSNATLHGYQVYCKACQNIRHAEWSKSRPDIKEYRAEKQKEWRDKNPRLAKDFKLRLAYGVPLGTYAKLFEKQAGKCAICYNAAPGGKGDFHVDHCHVVESVRGLLCHNCNVGIGHFKHDVSLLLNAISYLTEAGRES